MNRLCQNLRLEPAFVICENPDVGGQVAVDLHKPQSGKAVEPGIGHLFHHLLIVLLLDTTNQGLPLPLFCGVQQMTIHAVRIGIARILFGDAIHSGALGDAVDQFTTRPHRVFLDCVLIHQ